MVHPRRGRSLLIAPRFFTLRLDGPGRTAPSKDPLEGPTGLGVESVLTDELGQRWARDVLQTETGLLGPSGHRQLLLQGLAFRARPGHSGIIPAGTQPTADGVGMCGGRARRAHSC